MQLFGPTFVGHLPALPVCDLRKIFITVDDLPMLGVPGQWGLVDLAEPTDIEWIELAFRLGVQFTHTDLEFCRAANQTTHHMVVHDREGRSITVATKLALATVASFARMSLRDVLPAGQTFAVDKLGTMGRACVWSYEDTEDLEGMEV